MVENETVNIIAKALYDHWASSSYEAKRQGTWEDAPTNLRNVFIGQATSVEGVLFGSE